jgi:hypothetical protein
MAISTIESDIIEQLKTGITDLKIEGFPDNWSDYKMIHPKGAVLVQYMGSRFESPELSFQSVQQLRNLEFGLVLIIKGLRDKTGAYAYIDTIISTLTGYKPTGCLEMYALSDDFTAEENGFYFYELRFMVPTDNYE